MLRLTTAQREELCLLAEAGYPREVCGFLLGRWDGEDRVVIALRPARNVWDEQPAIRDALLESKPEGPGETPGRADWEAHGEQRRFLIAPEQFAAADREACAAGLAIVGVYHSHPDHPAQPSPYDREMAMPEQSYVIVSVQGGRAAQVRSWQVEDFSAPFAEEPVAVQ